MHEPILNEPLVATLSSLEREIATPLGPVRVSFQNNPMLSVHISREENFFQTLARRWNQCLTSREDPHGPLQSVVDQGKCMSLEARRDFLKDFLYAASAATQDLESGANAESESLEQHAEQV